MKFGVGLPFWISKDFGYLTKFALAAEKLGFDSICIVDHGYSRWEALSTLSAMAVHTERIRLGTVVVDANRRNAVTLAQMTSTLDDISDGRYIFGVGSGTGETNPRGFRVDKPATRMKETIEIVKKLWTEPKVNYRGVYYNLDEASIRSRPVQKPHPPIWIAAHGPRMLRIAGELGDGYITQTLSTKAFKEKLSTVRGYARKAGRDPEEIEAVFSAPMSISKNHSEALSPIQTWLRRREDMELSVETIDDSFIVGDVEDWIIKIERYIEAGVDYFVATRLYPPRIETLELIASEILSYFK